MAYCYSPLEKNHIRLLTLQPTNDHNTNPTIRCHLEAVPLDTLLERPSVGNYKGKDHFWPEALEQRETAIIFKKRPKTSLLNIPQPSGPFHWDSKKDDHLPWALSCGDYIALSYKWDQGAPSKSICIDGKSLPVNSNVFEALLQLRKSCRIRQGFKLWIDAICINQHDIQERNQQVALMQHIYASAWHVLVWLGPEADGSSTAFAALSWISSFSTAYPSLDTFYREKKIMDARPFMYTWPSYKSPLRKSVHLALLRLLTREYWQRMWILQEVAMARYDAPVLCGNSCLTWDVIHTAVKHIARDEGRLGRDIAYSFRPGVIASGYSHEFGRSRLPGERQWSSERLWNLLVEMTRVQKNQKSLAASQPILDELRPLLLSREAEVSDNKDRVYGIMGLVEVSNKVKVKPDYALPLRNIYIDFTSRVIANGDLNLLRLKSSPCGPIYDGRSLKELSPKLKPSTLTDYLIVIAEWIKPANKQSVVSDQCTHKLPSWTICWICKPAPTVQLMGPYNAGGSGSTVTISNGPDPTLVVIGCLFDTIASLSSFHISEIDKRYPMNYSPTEKSLYGDKAATRTALWRTLVADTSAEGHKHAPEGYSWLLTPRIWADEVSGVFSHGLDPYSIMKRNKNLILCGFSLKELIFGGRKILEWNGVPLMDPHDSITAEEGEILSWAANVKAMRRLIGTSQGRMGLAPAAAEAADSIAVLRGCSTPMILRPFLDGWKVIGECYIHGVMNGEMLEHHVTREILIY